MGMGCWSVLKSLSGWIRRGYRKKLDTVSTSDPRSVSTSYPTPVNVIIDSPVVGNQAAIGVGPPTDALLFVICCPVGPYYPQGFKPVALYGTTEYIRAAPGGKP